MTAPALARPMTRDVWVTCSRYSGPLVVSRYRHIVRRGWQRRDWVTTACGATGNSGAWRSDYRKAACPECVAAFNEEEQA